MATVRLYANKSAIIDSASQSSNNHSAASTTSPSTQYLAVGFDTLPEVYWFNKLQTLWCYVYVASAKDTLPDKITARYFLSPFDENSITYANKPTSEFCCQITPIYSLIPQFVRGYDDGSWGSKPINMARNGCLFQSVDCILQTSRGSNKPYIELDLQDALVGLQLSDLSPAEGAFVQKNKASIFSWNAAVSEDDQCYGEVAVKSAVFRWKNESGTTRAINAGSSLSLEVPANTFSGSSIQWQVEVTANSGVVTTSDWVTVSTAEPTSSAIAKSPKNTAIDGTAENVFFWEHVISTGTAQTAFEIQSSPDNKTWKTILTGTTKATSAVIPSDTLAGGDLYWRVRTFNSDGVAGAWSEAAHAIVIAAPDVPALTITDNAPRFSLRWQQSGQQAYELQVDGLTLVKRFGEESNYSHGEYLRAGSHTVQIRIQNKYGLWSDWGRAALQITNTDGPGIELRADANNVVTLNWSTDGEYDKFLIYRNGKLIGKTATNSFTDYFAIGNVDYHVRGVYTDSGSYTMSNGVEVNASAPCIMISSVNEPLWQKLKLSKGSLRSTGLSASHSVTYLHHVGAALPSAEIGEAVSMTYELDCAFRASDMDAARVFEALLGKLVCVKEPGGERYIGVLDSLSKENVGRLYRSYKARIALVDWEEGAT